MIVTVAEVWKDDRIIDVPAFGYDDQETALLKKFAGVMLRGPLVEEPEERAALTKIVDAPSPGLRLTWGHSGVPGEFLRQFPEHLRSYAAGLTNAVAKVSDTAGASLVDDIFLSHKLADEIEREVLIADARREIDELVAEDFNR